MDGAGHGETRFVQSSRFPFPAPIAMRPARRFPRLPTSEQAARILQAAPSPRVSLGAAPPLTLGVRVFEGSRATRVSDPSSSLPLLGVSSPVRSTQMAGMATPIAGDDFWAPSTLVSSPWTALFSDSMDSPLHISPPSMMAALDGQVISSANPDRSIVQPHMDFDFPSLTVAAMAKQHSSPADLDCPTVQPPVDSPTRGRGTPLFLPATWVPQAGVLNGAAAPLPVGFSSPPPIVHTALPSSAVPTPTTGGDGVSNLNPPPVTVAPTPALLIGNVPLTHCSNSFSLGDKIAEGFHNSSRKTLSFVAPSIQNGEVVVRPSIDIIRHGSSRWKTTAVGYFLDKRPYFHHLNEYVCSIWPSVKEVTATVTGFYFFQFKMEAAMEEVIEGGPWLFQGQPIILQKWEPGMALRKLKHTQVPVWIKLRHLPVELWTTDGLSTVANGIGKPFYPDAITRACTRLDFARVCVMLDISSKLPRHVIIMVPLENGGESACKVEVEYEWLPPKCNACHSLGHATLACDSNKLKKPAVSVYVQKPRPEPITPPLPADPVLGHAVAPDFVDTEQRDGVTIEPTLPSTAKGKEIMIFNPFDILQSHDDVAEGNSRGPISSPSTGDPC
ncbi:hypothetical protein Sango_3071800 [Sesamum angolense]|uniref:DUF4283 domain-containing protein n=1 Tax=Sesamum angolense TaxID=2727404 RepID=A0AAE1TB48_9LAMI|nr:hypothetical protein Sango_3071800 [Sesamum angolense]